MTGLSAVIARIGDIESQITSLDAAARTTAAAGEKRADAAGSGGTTFAQALEAAKSVSAPTAVDAAAGATDKAAAAVTGGPELVSALQTFFTANATASPGGVASGDQAAQLRAMLEALG